MQHGRTLRAHALPAPSGEAPAAQTRRTPRAQMPPAPSRETPGAQTWCACAPILWSPRRQESAHTPFPRTRAPQRPIRGDLMVQTDTWERRCESPSFRPVSPSEGDRRKARAGLGNKRQPICGIEGKCCCKQILRWKFGQEYGCCSSQLSRRCCRKSTSGHAGSTGY